MADLPPNEQSSIILKLKSKDGEVFEVEKPVAMQINFIKGMLEDVDEVDGMEIPMGEVEASILAKVVEFCKFHHQQELNQTSADEIDRWEKSFVQVDKSTLFQLILVSISVLDCLSAVCKYSISLTETLTIIIFPMFMHGLLILIPGGKFSRCAIPSRPYLQDVSILHTHCLLHTRKRTLQPV